MHASYKWTELTCSYNQSLTHNAQASVTHLALRLQEMNVLVMLTQTVGTMKTYIIYI